ncbi:tRNA (cytidine(34)-2'-O)-methyltransferase [Candidatus Terasakiella magnetica]|uniref:tRNA (cytidine(34)-2'-O)-methyltransferase n=1 Tax=Candidatus Terasakiella magnetica TaxID=1867952 RepID=A0A1C3RGN7_9PROT|nr:tRNA (cytidine(34)-2'-O)-methyltransferase [Candidatus Terasakiella magnetica]SCA56408.1 tRNA (cytidine(34)-2'-O)-methyltransferase [Candidatus Terasakiella magnetica]
MRLALYQPDIPQNTGTLLRLAACMGIGVDIIEPCGFVLDDKRMRRAGMDYLHRVDLIRHNSWEAFLEDKKEKGGRIILLSTKAAHLYTEFTYRADDTLLLGRESQGVPAEVHDRADERLIIPMAEGMRSINVAISGAMVLGEGLRQTGGFPA